MKELFKDLKRILPEKRILYNRIKIVYNYDATGLYGKNSLVLFPSSEKEISKILKFLKKYEIPVYPRGAGTGKSGGSIPLYNGVVICTLLMDKIKEINFKERRIKVQAGVITARIKKILEENKFFYPPDPQSYEISSIGGNVATNAGGPNSLKYGTTGGYILSLKFVTADGDIINAGKETYKFVMGYDFKDLLCGSEGTLGIITEIDLKFLPLPEKEIFYIVEDLPEKITEIFENKIIPSKAELFDDKILIGIDEKFKESEKILKSVFRKIKKLNKREKEKYEKIRKEKSVSIWRERGGKISVDVCVPLRKTGDFIGFLKKFKDRVYPYGHLGSGNLHTNILFNPENLRERDKIWEVREEIINFVLKIGGTCSGEHGTGILYSKYVERELGKENYRIQLSIKKMFDPKNILNRGKIFDKGKSFERLKHIYFEEKPELAKLCTLCGLCNRVCPLFEKYKREEISPRGFLFFYIKKLKIMTFAKDYKKYFNFCLKCKKCFNICPNGVKMGEIVKNMADPDIRRYNKKEIQEVKEG